MRVLLTGATGFIGSHLADAIEAAGHTLVCASRDLLRAHRSCPQRDWVAIDFATAATPDEWLPLVEQIDVVINAVGIVRERRGQTFEALHVRAPQALFAACARAGVRRVIQLSALGADEHARSRYHLSKRMADDALLALPLDAVVLQPSLVFGLDGGSTQIFLQMAALPVIPVPQGAGSVQPIHIDDLAALVVRLIAMERLDDRRIALVGPEAVEWTEYLSALRTGLGLGRPRFVHVPARWAALAATLSQHLPNALLTEETWQMLRRGNTASVEPLTRYLGARPRGLARFVPPFQRRFAAIDARLAPLLALLRWSIACVWIVTGFVSMGVYPVDDSLALLARVGAHGTIALWLLYGAAALDLLLGIATLFYRRRWLWAAQMTLIGGYTLLITWRLPEFWLHPYGPVLKNLPMLAALLLLFTLERRR